MNSLGTFIVNGIYRIVINQILQSPDIYYRSELDHNGISVYSGTIISDWGGRLELEIDRKARIWARAKKIFPTGISAIISSAMLCFYLYVLVSGGNPPPKKLKPSASVA
ncbi:hypothetical protein KIW84_045260 [Lathyrus oleraceus]|uniref:RNA polymerase Rpb2 domain-containing protein n=1 Tax=Pisum sativum TaxID=3888 RepID=A0A9D5AX15_PEA|nr:hypothetical protein KIW84_045260 [Pisum sativum]